MSIFIDVIVPVLLILALGYLITRGLKLEVESTARLSLYLLSSALMFVYLLDSELSSPEIWTIVGFGKAEPGLVSTNTLVTTVVSILSLTGGLWLVL